MRLSRGRIRLLVLDHTFRAFEVQPGPPPFVRQRENLLQSVESHRFVPRFGIQMFDPAGSRKLIQIAAICAGIRLRTQRPPSPPAGNDAEVSAVESAEAVPSDRAAPAPRKARPDDWFEDLTERSGVRFTYRNGEEGGQYTILETVGGGVAMLDYDNDDDLDLFFPGGGRISSSPPEISGLSGVCIATTAIGSSST